MQRLLNGHDKKPSELPQRQKQRPIKRLLKLSLPRKLRTRAI